MLSYLSLEGRKIVNEALKTKVPNNISHNQADAFGYVVYYKGKPMRRGYANLSPQSKGTHKGWAKYGIPDGTGREWLDDFINTYEPPQTDFALLIVNAAFYSRIQEDGAAKYREPFRVLSQVVSMIKNLESKIEGAKAEGINININ